MLPMLKRHEIQVLRKAGHNQREVAGGAGVSIDTVRRVEREEVVTCVEDARARDRQAESSARRR
jgi:hypothetical protein